MHTVSVQTLWGKREKSTILYHSCLDISIGKFEVTLSVRVWMNETSQYNLIYFIMSSNVLSSSKRVNKYRLLKTLATCKQSNSWWNVYKCKRI